MFLSLLLFSALALADGGTPNPGEPGNPLPPPSAKFDFMQEGIYALDVTCDPKPEDCNPHLMSMVNLLSVVDSHSPLGVWVMIASSSPTDVLDAFYAAQIGSSTREVTAAPRPGSHVGHFSYVNFVIDPASGELSGTLYDYKSDGHMVLHGHPVSRIADLLHTPPESGAALASLFGVYRGSIAGMDGTLMIRTTPAHKIYAHFSSDHKFDDTPAFMIKFSSGEWNAKSGLMQLTFDNPRFFAIGELALVLNPGVEQPSFRSIYFNGFAHGSSEFRKAN
ncbi:MAG: hypothetical protein ACXWQO_06210 [Bdellovibrionota bacterium]